MLFMSFYFFNNGGNGNVHQMDNHTSKGYGHIKRILQKLFGLNRIKSIFPLSGKADCLFRSGRRRTDRVEDRENHGEQQSVSLGIAVRDFDLLYQKAAETQVPHSEPQILGKNTKCFFLTDPNGVRLQIIKGTEA